MVDTPTPQSFVFKNGSPCWNEAARSVKVTLKCGRTNQVVAVSEPKKCEYYMEMETVVACSLTAPVIGMHEKVEL